MKAQRATGQTWGDLEALQSELGRFSGADAHAKSPSSLSSLSSDASSSSNALASLSTVGSTIASLGTMSTVASMESTPTLGDGSTKSLRPAMAATSSAVYNSTLMLECLEDMVLQEIAAMEAVLEDYCSCMCACPSMNTYTVRRRAMYPFCAHS